MINEYNNTYHSIIKIKPVGVKSSTYIDFNEKSNKEDPKSEVGDHLRISKYKKTFVKVELQMSQKIFSWLKKLKILSLGHMLLVILTVKRFLGHFMKKNLKRQIKQS